MKVNGSVPDAGYGAGPLLKFGKAPVTSGEFGAWTPIGAAALAGGGYEVAWKNGATGQYTVWDTDANGNYVGAPIGQVAGTDVRLERLEVEYKSHPSLTSKAGTKVVTSKKDFCRLLKGAQLLTAGKKSPAINEADVDAVAQ